MFVMSVRSSSVRETGNTTLSSSTTTTTASATSSPTTSTIATTATTTTTTSNTINTTIAPTSTTNTRTKKLQRAQARSQDSGITTSRGASSAATVQPTPTNDQNNNAAAHLWNNHKLLITSTSINDHNCSSSSKKNLTLNNLLLNNHQSSIDQYFYNGHANSGSGGGGVAAESKVNNNNNTNRIKCLKSPSNSIGAEIFLKPPNNLIEVCCGNGQASAPKFLSLTELNNYRKSLSPVQKVVAPVATILNDLSPVPTVTNSAAAAGTKVTNSRQKAATTSASAYISPPMTLKGLHNNTPDAKAMRYYRLWIYTCNAVLFMAVIVFCGVAGKVLVADYKRLLVNGLNLGQPSFIYAYLALLIQSGFLQLIGCFGALRLSEKLLNAYWLLLLLLLIGDAILGVFWMFKFESVVTDLQKTLRHRLYTEYGTGSDFTELWDRLQIEERCCGVLGPQDYTINANRTYPMSCCNGSDAFPVSRRPLAAPIVFRTTTTTTEFGEATANNLNVVMASSLQAALRQANSTSGGGTASTDTAAEISWNHVMSASSAQQSSSVAAAAAAPGKEETQTHMRGGGPLCRAVYQLGCADRLGHWLKNTADILFVIGYCVIAFLKLCFLGILRYEIREMIQKIKLLQAEMASAILCVDAEQQLVHQTQTNQYCLQQQNTITSLNGGILRAEPKVGNRDRERTRIASGGGSCESEMESLLMHHDNNNNNSTPKYSVAHKQLFMCPNAAGGGGGQQQQQQQQQHQSLQQPSHVDLDSTSNCALILDELNQANAPKTACGIGSNNNYELSEFDTTTKATNYRLLNAPTVTKI